MRPFGIFCALGTLFAENCFTVPLTEGALEEQQHKIADPTSYVYWDGDYIPEDHPAPLPGSANAGENSAKLKRRQDDVDPFDDADLNADQFMRFMWFDRSRSPIIPKKMPSDPVCQTFRDTLKAWVRSFKYNEVPERQMFKRASEWILVAHWGNSLRGGPRSWPENTPHAEEQSVIRDIGTEVRATSRMDKWIDNRLSICQLDYLTGLLLLPPVFMTFSYEIGHVPDRGKDPPTKQPWRPWIELPELPRTANPAPTNQQQPAHPPPSNEKMTNPPPTQGQHSQPRIAHTRWDGVHIKGEKDPRTTDLQHVQQTYFDVDGHFVKSIENLHPVTKGIINAVLAIAMLGFMFVQSTH